MNSRSKSNNSILYDVVYLMCKETTGVHLLSIKHMVEASNKLNHLHSLHSIDNILLLESSTFAGVLIKQWSVKHCVFIYHIGTKTSVDLKVTDNMSKPSFKHSSSNGDIWEKPKQVDKPKNCTSLINHIMNLWSGSKHCYAKH